MTFCVYMDPLNWAQRYYLCQAIDELGFENGWEPIIEKVNLLCTLFVGTPLGLNPQQIHLFYLQMLAEFGDFRDMEDPLTPPSQEIKDKIKKMRRSQLRHELLLLNNQLRYNNCILRHHNEQPLQMKPMRWVRNGPPQQNAMPVVSNDIIQVCLGFNKQTWYDLLPQTVVKDEPSKDQRKEPFGLKQITLDTIIARCVTGVTKDPLELYRDIMHLYTNCMLGTLSERERKAVNGMKDYVSSKLEPYLSEDPRWLRIREFLE